jgi:hypothetical protein
MALRVQGVSAQHVRPLATSSPKVEMLILGCRQANGTDTSGKDTKQDRAASLSSRQFSPPALPPPPGGALHMVHGMMPPPVQARPHRTEVAAATHAMLAERPGTSAGEALQSVSSFHGTEGANKHELARAMLDDILETQPNLLTAFQEAPELWQLWYRFAP